VAYIVAVPWKSRACLETCKPPAGSSRTKQKYLSLFTLGRQGRAEGRHVWAATAAIGEENNLLTKYHEDTGRAVYNYLCASLRFSARIHPSTRQLRALLLRLFSLSLSSLPFQMHEPVPALRSVLPSVGPPPACSITSNHRSIALGHSRRLAFGGIYYSLCSNLKDPDRQGQPKTPTVWTVVLEALARLQCCTASFIYRYTSILDVGKDFN
jgi:hypothetical protein